MRAVLNRASGFFTMMAARTGGAATAGRRLHQLGIRAGQIARCFMSSISSSMIQNLANIAIRTATVDALWKLAIMSLWPIKRWLMVCLNH